MPVGVVGEGGQVVRFWSSRASGSARARSSRSSTARSRPSRRSQLAAQIEVARADANLAQANLERALKLVDRGFISKADVDRLTATRDAANARVRGRAGAARRDRARAPPGSTSSRRRRAWCSSATSSPARWSAPAAASLFRIARGGEMELLAQLERDPISRDLAVGVAARRDPGRHATRASPARSGRSRRSSTSRTARAPRASRWPTIPRCARAASPRRRSSRGTQQAPMLPGIGDPQRRQGQLRLHRRQRQQGRAPRRSRPARSPPTASPWSRACSGNERVVLRAGGFLTPGDNGAGRSARQADPAVQDGFRA